MFRPRPSLHLPARATDASRCRTGITFLLLVMAISALNAQVPKIISPTLDISDFSLPAETDALGIGTSPGLMIIMCETPAPTGPSYQGFCTYDDPVVADLEATGENIRWYDEATGGICLASNVPLVSGHYYATQTVGGRESKNRLDVRVEVIDTRTPAGPREQSFCAVSGPVVNDLESSDDHVYWYLTEEGGQPLDGSHLLSQTYYYAGQVIYGCESQTRLAVSVLIHDSPAPTGPSTQTFCAYDEPLISDLSASGEEIQWYNAAEGGIPLESGSYLETGTYFASQMTEGCESSERLEVLVEVGDTPSTSAITGKENPDCRETGLTYFVELTQGSSYAWTVPEGASIVSGAAGPDNSEIEVDFGSKSGQITVTETNESGCTGTPVLLDVTLPECGPMADFTANETEACLEEEISFTDLSTGTDEGTVFSWDFGPDAIPSLASGPGPHAVKYNSPGFKTIHLTVSGEVPSTLTKTDYILIHPDPVVDLGKDTALCDGNSLVLDAGSFIAYEWSTGDVSRTIVVNEGAGNVSVTVTDAYGCQSGDAIAILPCDPADLLGKIPNIITPNNDHINDAWVIENIHLFPDVTILIYDRWGRLVYEVDGGYNNDWYGTGPNGNDLPVGTYYYIMDLKVQGLEPIKGTISILR